MVPGSVSTLTRTAADQSNAGTLITAPAHALYLTTGNIYAPSIIAAGSDGALYLQLGQTCKIGGSLFNHSSPSLFECPIQIDLMKIIITARDDSNSTHTLSFNISIDDAFIDGQANMMVTFIHIVNKRNYNISGYLYFDSQPNARCNSSTSPPPTDANTTPCDCPMTGNSNPIQNTTTTCLDSGTLMSGSMLNHLDLLGSVSILIVSLLLFAT